MCPYYEKCLICEEEFDDKDFNENSIALGWHKSVNEYQLSNAQFGHLNCLSKSNNFIYGTRNKKS